MASSGLSEGVVGLATGAVLMPRSCITRSRRPIAAAGGMAVCAETENWGVAAEAGVAVIAIALRTTTSAITALSFFIVSSRGDLLIVLIAWAD